MSDQNNDGFSSMEELMEQKTQDNEQTHPQESAEVESPMGQQDVTAPEENPIPQEVLHQSKEDAADKAFEQHFQTNYQEPEQQEEVSAPAQTNKSEVTKVQRDDAKRRELSPNELDSDIANISSIDTNSVSSVDLMAAINKAVNRDDFGRFRAVALKSGYAFEVEPLRFAEIERLINTVGDTHSEQVKLVKTVHSKIKWFSCGYLSYSDFINSTAYDDFDTILYAIYSATYPGNNKYPIKCQGCGEDNTIEVSTDKLISKVDEDKLTRVRSVLESAAQSHKEAEFMPLEMRDRIKLRESGIIVEYGVSSISDFLSGLSRMQNGLINSKTGKMDNSKSELTSMVDFELAIDYMYVPHPESPGKYIKISDKSQINSILSKLSRVDGPQFKEHLRDVREQYRVDYTIPKFNCGHCGKESPELTLNFEQLLFTEMNREKEA